MKILLMGDIHIGSIKNVNYVYNVITDIFDKELRFKHCDAVIILGDFFDKLFKVNEVYTSLSINIMSYLIRICKKSKTKIRLIYGTESHEMSQYTLFNYHLNSSSVDIKLITTVTEEELFPNVNVLYIPEEYIDNKLEYYRDYLYSGKRYNFIFGHGIIAEGMKEVDVTKHEESSNEKKVPIFKSGELSSISDLSVWNHYHTYTDMGNNCYYLGSLFRDSFGEEEPKGYGIIEDNKLKFIENTEAFIYKTYTFDEDSEVYKDMSVLVKEINMIKENHIDIFNNEKIGKIRLKFNIPIDVDPSFKENLRNLLFENKSMTYLIKEASLNSIMVENKIETEYNFILDNSLELEDKIHRFINKNYDIELSLEELTSLINDELKI